MEDWSLHFQATGIFQWHGPFHSPYSGPHSLQAEEESATTLTSTLFLAGRLWRGGEIYFDPEIAGGKGLSETRGIAGFPNGEATRVSATEPTPYIARLFLRQTFDLGGEPESAPGAPHQLAGPQRGNRLTLSAGKLSALDLFDSNSYSHDPRTQFMNWSLMANGAWDYPANTRGYTYGAAAELQASIWAFRYGVFLMPTEANGPELDFHLGRRRGQVLELERRHSILGREGKVRLLSYLNEARMGSFHRAIARPDLDLTLTRRDSTRFGFGSSLEQELTGDLGLFLRVGWNDGRNESFAFTEIDRTFQFGLSQKGSPWRRPQDQIGAAFSLNGLSGDHREFLKRGGLGFILGDGRLSYELEKVLELYYLLQVQWLSATLDYQLVEAPGYNGDRGPVSILGLRLHVELKGPSGGRRAVQ